MDQINEYLLEVKSHLHLDREAERNIAEELYAHLHEKERELHLEGKSLEHSGELAVKSMGRPRVIVPAVFAIIVATTLLGCWWGKPNWLYSWIGFSLFPLLVAGFTSRHHIMDIAESMRFDDATFMIVFRGIVVVIFYILAVRFILATTIRVARRDWLLASFMLLPLPALGIWLYHLEQIGGFFQPVNPRIFEWDSQMAAVSALMAVSLGTCVRLRQRKYRMIGLIVIFMNASAYVTHCIWSEMSLLPVALVSVCLLAFLFTPVFALKPPAKHGKEISQWIQELEGGGRRIASR